MNTYGIDKSDFEYPHIRDEINDYGYRLQNFFYYLYVQYNIKKNSLYQHRRLGFQFLQGKKDVYQYLTKCKIIIGRIGYKTEDEELQYKLIAKIKETNSQITGNVNTLL